MGATGESVRRLTDFGHNPAWSPDGKEITFATERALNPYGRNTVSQLWSVEWPMDKGKCSAKEMPSSQNVSPHDSESHTGPLMLAEADSETFRTIPAGGGDPVAVTNDPAVDWSPVWSPDGNYLYFFKRPRRKPEHLASALSMKNPERFMEIPNP